MAGDALFATLILAAMCAVMWYLARVARRRMGLGAGTVAPGALRVVGKRPLDQRSSIWVVEVAGRHILLGSGADGTVTKLDDISADEYAAMTTPAADPSRRLRPVVGGGPACDSDDGTRGAAAEEPRFATVGESFNMLLGKARDARAGRRASHGRTGTDPS